MVFSKIKYTKYNRFYEGYNTKSPELILLLMVLTFGLYAIYWIYQTNMELERASEEVPSSLVGIFIMMILPFSWGFFFFMFNFIFDDVSIFFALFETFGWIIIIFLILEYLYRFCLVYADIVMSDSRVWYYSFFPGFLALTLGVLGIIEAFAFFFFIFIVIPAMQAQLNTRYEQYELEELKVYFNYFEKKKL
ncbi:MAG: hypothetical protein KC589_09570 [Nanoarchaeota archaeon]|nr:hypothetical protein [Nanoarchaeota archaeon]